MRPEKLPGGTIVDAAPQNVGSRVQGMRLHWVEDEEMYGAAEVEHSPLMPAVVADVGASHIAGEQYFVRVMRADGDVKHGASATGADNARDLREKGSNQRGKKHGHSHTCGFVF